MFKYFKEKLKSAVDRFHKSAEAEAEEVTEEKQGIDESQDYPEEPEEKQETKEQELVDQVFSEKPEAAAEEAGAHQELEEKGFPEGETVSEIIEEKKDIEQKTEEKKYSEGALESTGEVVPEAQEEGLQEQKEQAESEEKPKKKGFFGRVTERIGKKVLNEKTFEELFFELEVVLLENNVAIEVVEKIKNDLKQDLVDKPIKKSELKHTLIKSLRDSIESLFVMPDQDLVEKIKSSGKKPYVVMFVGVNGSGKTTTIAKVTHMLKNNGLAPVIAGSDTFRAAALEQLQDHANSLNVKMNRHDYNADTAAVAFDTVKYPEAKNKDVVLIDTAGRLHSNKNLIEELKKINRVVKPDHTIFTGESITGNDCVEQANSFSQAVEFDSIILSKADIDEKGGAAISVSFITGKPIIYLGTGQEYEDLEKFNTERIMNTLGLED